MQPRLMFSPVLGRLEGERSLKTLLHVLAELKEKRFISMAAVVPKFKSMIASP